MKPRSRNLLVGALTLVALAPSMQAQTRPTSPRPKPQKPVEIPPAVVVLEVDTSAGDSTRTIIQRDFDFGDRIQPLVLDSTTMPDVCLPSIHNNAQAPLDQ